MTPSRSTFALAIALTIVGGACGDDSDSDGGGAAPAEPVTITADGFVWDTTEVTVPAGTEVIFANVDDTTHTASPRDGGFEATGDIGRDESVGRNFAEPGTYEFFCAYHPAMVGTVTVE